MTASPPVLFDVSRLVSRIGTGPLTGIDRVEAAWLAHIASRPHLLIARVARGQLLLPPSAGPAILRWINGDLSDLPERPGWRDRLAGRRGPVARATAALRQMALKAAGRDGAGLAREALRHLPADTAYLNVGHANLDREFLHNLRRLRRVVMIHDTIPLDHPEYTRAGQDAKFRARFINAANSADQLIAISAATAARIELWRKRLAITRPVPITVAHIGTTLTPADPAAVPADLDLSRPFFVTLGTIEPRKNHALLLDAWQILAKRLPAEKTPRLLILGRRGWENRAVFDRLDSLPPGAPMVERAGLPDAAVAALIERCHALLMPSFAEGFGLPLTEAAGRGIPVLATPLPTTQEILGDYATYLPPDDPDAWATRIEALAINNPSRMNRLAISPWDSHFLLIDQVLGSSLGGRGTQ